MLNYHSLPACTYMYIIIYTDTTAIYMYMLPHNYMTLYLFSMQDGYTPFDCAKKNGHDSVMEELKKQTASQPVATEPVAREPVVIAFKDIELKETVGKGAFGAVFKGYWTSSDGGRQLVAIKQLSKVVEKEVS